MSSICIRNVTLEYPIYDKSSRSLKDRVINKFGIGGVLSTDSKGLTIIIALTDVSLNFVDGDRVALLGHNGAGKSTLLKIFARVYKPQHGYVEVDGSVSSLFNINLGLDMTATGYENIHLRLLLHGFSRGQIAQMITEVAELSELGPYLDVPVRAYSQGMAMRLSFAICTSVVPDILLLDEWIGTGDQHFAEKSQQRLLELVGRSRIFVLATHRTDLVRQICNKVVILDRGTIEAQGPAEEMLEYYSNRPSSSSPVAGNPG